MEIERAQTQKLYNEFIKMAEAQMMDPRAPLDEQKGNIGKLMAALEKAGRELKNGHLQWKEEERRVLPHKQAGESLEPFIVPS